MPSLSGNSSAISITSPRHIFWANLGGTVTPLGASACGAVGIGGANTEGDAVNGSATDSVSVLTGTERGT